MSACVVVELPLKLVTPLNMRQHWKRVWLRGQREKAAVTLVLSPFRRAVPPPPRIVTLTRISAGTYDSDSLYACFKHVRDATARFIGVDDKDSADLVWKYTQEVGRRGEPKIRIRVEHNNQGAGPCID